MLANLGKKKGENSIDRKIDYVYGIINDLCWDNDWKAIDTICENAVLEDVDITIAILTATLCCKSKLLARKGLYDRCASNPYYSEPGLLEGLD